MVNLPQISAVYHLCCVFDDCVILGGFEWIIVISNILRLFLSGAQNGSEDMVE